MTKIDNSIATIAIGIVIDKITVLSMKMEKSSDMFALQGAPKSGASLLIDWRLKIMETTNYDYYYGDESNQFSFYRIPRQLIIGKEFKRLSAEAKLLYGLLLDRMELSAKNGWYDETGRVYIYYTLNEIQENLSCGHDKATKLLVELDVKRGIGLIERIKHGQGRPAKICVKRFVSGSAFGRSRELQSAEVKTAGNQRPDF